MLDSDPKAEFSYLAGELAKLLDRSALVVRPWRSPFLSVAASFEGNDMSEQAPDNPRPWTPIAMEPIRLAFSSSEPAPDIAIDKLKSLLSVAEFFGSVHSMPLDGIAVDFTGASDIAHTLGRERSSHGSIPCHSRRQSRAGGRCGCGRAEEQIDRYGRGHRTVARRQYRSQRGGACPSLGRQGRSAFPSFPGAGRRVRTGMLVSLLSGKALLDTARSQSKDLWEQYIEAPFRPLIAAISGWWWKQDAGNL